MRSRHIDGSALPPPYFEQKFDFVQSRMEQFCRGCARLMALCEMAAGRCIYFPSTPSRRTGLAVLSHARRKGRFRPSAGTADTAPHQKTKDRSLSGPSYICAFCTFLRISHILAYSAHSARPCAFCAFGRILPVSAHSARTAHFRAVTHSQPLSFLWI